MLLQARRSSATRKRCRIIVRVYTARGRGVLASWGASCDSESSSVALPLRCKPRPRNLSATSVSGVYTPSRFHKEGSLGRYDATPKFIKKLLAHQAAKAVVYLAGTQPELDGAAAGLLRTIDSARGQRVGPKRDRWARPPKMAGQPAMRAPRRRAASTARLGALLAALPAAAARPYLGAWVRNDSLAPTFDRRLLSYAPHFHEAQMGRNRKCDTGHDTSWRWAWKPVGKKRPMRLKSGDGLCDALRGTRVINIGDSLTHQLVETWRVCRVPFFPRLLDPRRPTV